MPKLVCDDCGEVLEEDLSESEAEDMQDELQADDHRHDSEAQDENESSDQNGSAGGLDERQDPSELEDQLEEEYNDKLDEIDDDDKVEDATEDIEDYANAADSENMNIQVRVGSQFTDPGARWDEAERGSERIASVFKDKLRQKRKSKTYHGQRSGTFDSNRMIQADRGDPRVFKREDEGDEAEYEAYFVLDRSYSMKYSEMGPAEGATATLMLALEEAGVKTELVDFKNDTPRVIKTKSQNAEDEKGNIMRGGSAADGGTPLGAVMELMEGRLEGTDGQPFVISVTDGGPNSESKYLDAIEDIDAPILGVTVGSGGVLSDEQQNKFFDVHVTVEQNANLVDSLEELARGVMF